MSTITNPSTERISLAGKAGTLSTSQGAKSNFRIASIGVLRGFVIVFMMLDHVRKRFFLHVPVGDARNVETISDPLCFSFSTREFAACKHR